jgi:vacuolar iron transporter family protein
VAAGPMDVSHLSRFLRYTWAAPTTMVGLLAGFLTLCTGGRVQCRSGALEFHGGFSRWLGLRCGFSAMTLGHAIIGLDALALEFCRIHEQAHVRQVERWGGLFIPAYLAASLLAWWQGGHYYFDNHFERDARRACGEGDRTLDDYTGQVERDSHRACGEGDRTLDDYSRNPDLGALMHQIAHVERHFTASALVRDIVIGMSDGLTVPFALAAGLSGTGAEAITTSVVVTAGLAEVAAGSIAMGLGGYLAARSDAEHYANEKRREQIEVVELPDVEREEVAVVFRDYGLTEAQIEPILEAFERNHPAWVDFMMRFELGLEEPDPRRALQSALTIAGAYIAGGMIPLGPYFFVAQPRDGLVVSVVVTLIALAVFGYIKGLFTGTRPARSALHTTLIGGLAAAAAFVIARLFGAR